MPQTIDPFASVRGVPTGDPRIWPLEPLLARTRFTPKGLATFTGQPRPKALLTDEESDRYAILAGFHPVQVWPNWCGDVA